MSEQRFTIFCGDGFLNNLCDDYQGLDLQALVEKGVKEFAGDEWVAWAPEATTMYGGTKAWDTLRAESLAAGRLIKKTEDGKFVAVIPGGGEKFRVGGIYRQHDGRLVRLHPPCRDIEAPSVWAKTLGGGGVGHRYLADGRDIEPYNDEIGDRTLIPGECDEQGNPINAEKPDPGSPEIAGTPDPFRDPSAQHDEKGAEAAAAWRENQKAKAEYIAAEDARRAAARLPTGKPGDPYPALAGLLKVR